MAPRRPRSSPPAGPSRQRPPASRGRPGPRLPVKRQVSAGGVVVRRGPPGIEVALTARKGGTVWCLPKGLLEPDETPEQTALREVREETGLSGRLIEKLGEITYWYASKEEGARFHKTVHFYLMAYAGGDIRNHDFEVDEVRWFSGPEALAVLSYASEREIAQKALEVASRVEGDAWP